MAGTFKRTQLLLRKEDQSPGGFVRMEQSGGKCTVEVNASGIHGDARIVLFRPEGGGMQPLGPLIKGAASFSIAAEEAEGCTQAAVVFGDKVLLAGGEGADFVKIRKRLAKANAPSPPPMEAQRHEIRPSTRPQAVAAPAPYAEDRPADVDMDAIMSDVDMDAMMAAAMTPAMDPEDEPAAEPDIEPVANTAEEGAWELTPVHTPGMPEQIEGKYVRDGEVVATLYGIAGVYAPEPPPGLAGFTWDNGYWVYVRGDAPSA